MAEALIDPAHLKTVVSAIFTGGMIWGGIRAGARQQKDRQIRQGREITRLRQYKAWSHRAISILISFHQLNHPGQHIIEDWREIDEGTNGDGGNNGDN